MLKTTPLCLLLSVATSTVMPLIDYSLESTTRMWTFEEGPPASLPSEFQVGTLFDGRTAGEWKIVQTDAAYNGTQVLAQLMGKGAEHAYKIVLIQSVTATDLDMRVSFLPISGKADMGGGLIWRATDDRNYYLARANPLEQNIRVYRVVRGIRHLLDNFDQTIDTKHWHTLRIIHRGCQVTVLYDDKEVFKLCDKTFDRGMVGLWTKSDAITYFDDLQLEFLQ